MSIDCDHNNWVQTGSCIDKDPSSGTRAESFERHIVHVDYNDSKTFQVWRASQLSDFKCKTLDKEPRPSGKLESCETIADLSTMKVGQSKKTLEIRHCDKTLASGLRHTQKPLELRHGKKTLGRPLGPVGKTSDQTLGSTGGMRTTTSQNCDRGIDCVNQAAMKAGRRSD